MAEKISQNIAAIIEQLDMTLMITFSWKMLLKSSFAEENWIDMCKDGEVTSDLDMIGRLTMSNAKGQKILIGTKEEDVLENNL